MALEYNITVGGVTLEGRPTNPDACYLLQKVSGLDDSPLTDEVDPRPVGDGDVFAAQSARGLSLTVEGLIVAQDHAALRARERALRASCPTGDQPWPVTVTGRIGDPPGGLQAMFRKSAPIQMADDGASGLRYVKPFQLALRSPEAWWVDPSPQGLHQIDIFPYEYTGFDWPIDWPVEWGDGLGPGVPLDNTASPVWPTLTVYGPCTNYRLENVTTGEAVTLDTALDEGETLTIDMRTRTAILADGENRYMDIDRAETTWWRLDAGVNHIRFRPAAADGDARLVVTWRDTY